VVLVAVFPGLSSSHTHVDPCTYVWVPREHVGTGDARVPFARAHLHLLVLRQDFVVSGSRVNMLGDAHRALNKFLYQTSKGHAMANLQPSNGLGWCYLVLSGSPRALF